MVTELAPAKVNLFLHVGRVKANGRHDLDSLVVFAGEEAADLVRAEPKDAFHFTAIGIDQDSDNLVVQAAQALREAAGVEADVAIDLEKQLPIAAGIGGGSADAGATLRALTTLWGLDVAVAEAVAPGLGGDVPAALLSETCLMRGEGERIAPVGLPAPLPAVLVNPGAACGTGAVFGAFDAAGGGALFAEAAFPTFPAGSNDLEAAARQVQPAVADVLDALEELDGALLTRMSGSGATCFALYDTLEMARAAEETILAAHPGWWARATMLGGAR
ncbi:UNVERIFIED_CONTAM: hypothetical protein GTU68_000033 [Idotea baltica]|nr:hypothetical protein [Idotea baltica]